MGKHGQYRALVGLLALLAAGPAAAECRLALLLALDISASVDEREDALQRGGLARALLAPAVQDAFLADPDRPVWLGVYEWSGKFAQAGLLPWLEIASAEDLSLAAAAIAGSERSRDDMPTALGNALGHAATLFRDGPDCEARTLDVAGDGRNNDGFPPASAYRAFGFDGITVNGLAVAVGEAGVADYYRAEVIHGPGAFVIVAENFRDYERAMRAKLLRELQGPVIGWLAPGGRE
ncbi:MAG: DUF1194 domain-containing protein [Rhodobacteraceae bacterium]|uniref:DUF1194 domain-containing protein n=1 Tax=Albidovulum sp. TaxID=1872424 RepID=UPI001D4C7FB7|nr:DUF1194 domain-containing protein [uncultured Defluviimonas sp.]MCB2115653.1 DUF1194 domain-containing protein [Paracoccaceae bacterium]MCC0069950.1 DUF1194 domain-containing protein [Paracoccaceae bacterium]